MYILVSQISKAHADSPKAMKTLDLSSTLPTKVRLVFKELTLLLWETVLKVATLFTR
jgi:hypothetical protein